MKTILNFKFSKSVSSQAWLIFKKPTSYNLPAISSPGFTLVELLLVIAIIGMLVGFLSISFFGVRQRTQDAQRKSDLKLIQSALEQYRSDADTYMPNDEYASIVCGEPFEDTGGVNYMQVTPCDPDSNTKYFYHTYNSGLSYVLVSCLENTDDTTGVQDVSEVSSFWPGSVTFPGITCDPEFYYVVQNP